MEPRVPATVPALLALACGLAAAAPAASDPGWIPLGPEAGRDVHFLAALPGAPSQLFAADDLVLFRSEGGKGWTVLTGDGAPLELRGKPYAVQAPGGSLYLATGAEESLSFLGEGDPGTHVGPRAILRSADGGESWRVARDESGLLALSAPDPARLFLATERAIERSEDGGDTWSDVTPGSLEDLLDSGSSVTLARLAMAPSDPDTAYLVVLVFLEDGSTGEVRVIRSRDAGATWEELQGGDLRDGSGRLAVDPVESDTVYLFGPTGVFRSLDGGSTGELRNDGLPSILIGSGPNPKRRYFVEDLVVDPEQPTVLYAAIGQSEPQVRGGVYRSTDAGASWAPAHDGLPLPLTVHDLILDPADSDILYAATPAGVFRSADRGEHWAPALDRLPAFVVAVALDPERPATVFTGDREGRIFVSRDGGQQWRRTGEEIPVPVPLPVDVLTIAPGDPSILFAHVAFTATARSTDGSATWEVIASPGTGDVTDLLVDRRDPKRVLAGVRQAGGVFVSSDLGDHWRRSLQRRVEVLAQAPSDPDVVYAGVSVLVLGQLVPTVCRSADGGESWGCSPPGFEDARWITALAVDPRDPSVILAAVAGPEIEPVLKSLDGGGTWTPAASGLSETGGVGDLAFDPRNAGVVWAATGKGVFRSPDGGATWTPLNRGLAHHSVWDLAIDASGRTLLAATPAGVFRFSAAAGPAPPPEIDWVEDPGLPGFRVKARIAQGAGAPIGGTREPACIPETVCLSGALPGRSELFVRVVGPKPNGFLWPTLVKFSTSRIEVWIQQLGTGELRYYELRGASPGFDELPGLFDRFGFLPD